jgi:hypothetical protein
MATSLGIYTYILEALQLAGIAIPANIQTLCGLTPEVTEMWNYS